MWSVLPGPTHPSLFLLLFPVRQHRPLRVAREWSTLLQTWYWLLVVLKQLVRSPPGNSVVVVAAVAVRIRIH